MGCDEEEEEEKKKLTSVAMVTVLEIHCNLRALTAAVVSFSLYMLHHLYERSLIIDVGVCFASQYIGHSNKGAFIMFLG